MPFPAIQRYRVRRSARKFIAQTVRRNGGELQMRALLSAAAKKCGLRRIEVEWTTLSGGLVATTCLRNDVAVITISQSCTTIRRTLAHELGHLILGHRHIDPTCLEYDPELKCPPGFERVHLAMLPTTTEPDPSRPAHDSEVEAELFAQEVEALWSLLDTIEHEEDRQWAYQIS